MRVFTTITRKHSLLTLQMAYYILLFHLIFEATVADRSIYQSTKLTNLRVTSCATHQNLHHASPTTGLLAHGLTLRIITHSRKSHAKITAGIKIIIARPTNTVSIRLI